VLLSVKPCSSSITPEITGIYFIIPQTAACCTELRVWKIKKRKDAAEKRRAMNRCKSIDELQMKC
jgi:hypothetical protein